MNHVMQPAHPHAHRVWVVPDTPLGRWASVLFTGAAITVIVAPVISYGVSLIASEPGADTPWFFALWGAMLMALGLGLIAGTMALVAMVRDHALLLMVPVVLGLVGTAVLVASASWPV
jgi:hypothetical protein